MKEKRKRGAPPGNHNALKHGFYSKDFKGKDRFDFDLASGIEGIDAEIALLRLELKKAASGGDTKNLVPLVKTALALEKLIRTRHKVFSTGSELEQAFKTVYRDVIFPIVGDNFEKLALFKKMRGVDPVIDNADQNP